MKFVGNFLITSENMVQANTVGAKPNMSVGPDAGIQCVTSGPGTLSSSGWYEQGGAREGGSYEPLPLV